MTLLSQFFQFAGARGKQLSFNRTLGWWPMVGKGESGRVGEWESGRVGEWESGRLAEHYF